MFLSRGANASMDGDRFFKMKTIYNFTRGNIWRSWGTKERLLYLSEPEPNSGCWLWLGTQNKKGYGNFQGRIASRVSYIAFRGEIAPDLTIDHLCKNKSCINPAHLEAVSNRENILRATTTLTGQLARRTTCGYGHVLTPHPLFTRWCRPCRLAYWKTYNATRRIKS